MAYVIVSQGVKDDFDKADYYRKQMNEETAMRLLGGDLRTFYEYALKRGWTTAKDVAEYVAKDHGPIYTAAFLIAA